MDIAELKSRLSILAVANQLGIQVNKYRKALCPFHDDKRPSLQFSEDKQICTCFSSACAGTMDAISLVERKLNVTTHEAIKWLQQEFNITASTPQKAEPVKTEVNYAKLFKVFEGNFKKSEKAQNYLKGRSLIRAAHEVGFNSTAWPQMKECIIFPLKDKDDNIVSLYGRATHNKANQNTSTQKTGKAYIHAGHEAAQRR